MIQNNQGFSFMQIPSFTDESFQENFIRVMSLMSQIERALVCKLNLTNGVRESEALCAYVLIYIHLVGSLDDCILFLGVEGGRSIAVVIRFKDNSTRREENIF